MCKCPYANASTPNNKHPRKSPLVPELDKKKCILDIKTYEVETPINSF